MKNQRKNQKGITLIALVITIIVLLILAGVTLSIVFNGGIINKSQTAVDKYTEESAKEKLSLAIFNYKMGKITGEAGEVEGKKSLNDYILEIGGIATYNETEGTYTVILDGYEFIVGDKNYEITSNGPATGESPSITKSEVILSEDKLSAIIKVTASAKQGGELTVKIGNETAILENGTYNLTVRNNGKYTIVVSETGLARKAVGTVEVSGIEKIKYTVTINTGTGIDSVTPTTEQVEEGKSIEIKATAQTGYTFSKWKVTSGNESDVASLTSATTTVTPTGNITIEATADEQAVLNNINGSANAKVGSGDFAYNNPVIPVGFRTSNEGASWSLSSDGTYVIGWNDGLVIQDGSGNQFVWVPVHNQAVVENGITIPAVPYEKWTSSKTGVVHSNCSDDTLPSGVTETYQIGEYGGFYIARYEAGIPSNLTTALTTASKAARNVSGIPVSKKGQIPWNYIDYTTSKANAERMYEIRNSKNEVLVKSGLVTGKQWDATMKWLENAPSSVNVQTDSTGWGNYYDAPVSGITEYSENYGASWTTTSSTTKGTSTSWLLKTGHTNYTSRKNIYDLAGNVWEWTNEIYSTVRVVRGGYYGNSGTDSPAAFRNGNSVDTADDYLGFRCVLYVQ